MSAAAQWSRRLAIFAATVALLTILLARTRALPPPEALASLGAAMAIALAALVLFFSACTTIWQTGRRGVGAAVGAFVIVLLTLAWPAWLAVQAVRLPVLADISTDIADPPHFSLSSAADKARGGFRPAGVPAKAREAQTAAYPDVEPIIIDLDPEEAFALALKTAAAKGWRLIDQHAPGFGRIGDGHADFVAGTLILGFDDDITIRLRPLVDQTQIDVRSATRYGRHDFGANARRIEEFAEEILSQMSDR